MKTRGVSEDAFLPNLNPYKQSHLFSRSLSSSEAYDKHVLSKFENTLPPRRLNLASGDINPPGLFGGLNGKSSVNRTSPGGTFLSSDPEATEDPTRKALNSTSSRPQNTADRDAGAPRTMSGQPATTDGRTVDVPRIGGQSFICECCPKKPKKFDNEEELRYV